MTRASRGGVPALAWALVVAAGAVALAALPSSPALADDIMASHNSARHGWDQAEPGLSPAEVSGGDFGRLFDTVVDGSVYAQPLVIGNTVVVTTEKAKAYALNSATGAVVWGPRNFGAPFLSSAVPGGCGDLVPDLGSTSTPVYDPATDTVYLTTKTVPNSTFPDRPVWHLHAVDRTSGAERTGYPFLLQGTADNDPSVTFDPLVQMQRPGLLLSHGVVYIAFGAHCDRGAYRGWVMGVGVPTGGFPAMKAVWTSVTGTRGRGGIWQGGGGLSTDGDDPSGRPRIFLATGNGVSPPIGPGLSPPGTLGDSLVRLGVDAAGKLSAKDFFAPSDVITLDTYDTDFGSGGPVPLPASFGTTSHPRLVVQTGKDGRVFLLDADNLGGRAQGPGGTDAVVQTGGPYKGVWGSPAVYGGEGGWVYYVENQGPLRAHRRSVTTSGEPALSSAGTSGSNFGYTSGSPIVTSFGTNAGSALVWTVYSSGSTGSGGQLRAYDAVPTAAGTMNLRWSAPIGLASKFAVPATSNGRVYVGTRDGHVHGFGNPSSAGLTGPTVDFGLVAVGSTSPSRDAVLTATRPLTVQSVTTAAPFARRPVTLPQTLATGGTITVPVTFAPTTTGSVAGSLTLATDQGQVQLGMHGVGTAPGLSASPPRVDFGDVPTGSARSLTTVITNTGTSDETITSIASPAAPFSAPDLPGAGTVLAAQESISVTVRFAPVAAGAADGDLGLSSTSGPLTVLLHGVGIVGQGHLVLRPTTTAFGSVALGNSRTVAFELANTGNIPVTITKAKGPSAEFVAATPLDEGLTINPEDVVRQEVTFTPTALGAAPPATYEVTGNDGQGTLTETLTGVGVDGSELPAPTGAGWTLNGAATVSGADVVLTPATNGVKGSVVAAGTLPSEGLDAHFTADLGSGGADGLSLSLLDATEPLTALGEGGGGLGYGGLHGVAVTLDTYPGATDPSGNFVGVATGASGTLRTLTYVATATGVPELTGRAHDVRASYHAGRLRVQMDGTVLIDVAVALPTTVRPAFTAATGGVNNRHVVRDVVITTPVDLRPIIPAVPVQDSSASLPFTQSHAPAGTTYTCSLNSGSAAPCTSPWTASGLATGVYSLVVTAHEPGIDRESSPRSFTVDTTAPTAAISALAIVALTSPLAISVTATDTGGAGVGSYDIRYRRAAWNAGFGAYTYPTGWAARNTAVSLSLTGGYEYCFSTRARDRAGNVSGWSPERCTSRPLDDVSLTRSSGWTRLSGNQFYRSTVTRSTVHGAALSRTGAQARQLFLLATTCSTCGSVDIYLGSRRLQTVSLVTSSTRYSAVITGPRLTGVVTGTLRIVIRSTGHRVDIDGVAFRRT
ncbi:MAG: choice-of-anchor D domain-containing protein [Sporichthyaceae bacterium]